MNIRLRQWWDRLFTLLALLSVVLVMASLVAILLPMMWRGGSAVVFQGTVEFRRLQVEQFHRGTLDSVQAEIAQAAQVRQRAYDILDAFSAGLDTSALEDRVRQLHRELGAQISNRDMPADQAADLRALSKELRDQLQQALEADNRAEAEKYLDGVLAHADDARLAGTVGMAYFDLARQYKQTVSTVDLSHREEYAKALKEVSESLRKLLGPRPGGRLPPVVMDQYGATRWDQAQLELDRLLWDQQWVPNGDGQALRKVRTPREEQFKGTALAELFPYIRGNAQAMLRPEWTFYWQYFMDDNLSGHYFGGVGPEIIGTLLITLLAIAVALPMGVAAAAYLVECAGESWLTKALRMFINTLAGVPSIVFGLFGLSFFVIYLQPRVGLPQGSSILAGSLTLALLVLPVVIRASEEAIRAVPRAYREAALGLGASGLRCFLTATLPAAMPGILTGLILSMSRAAGETAPILFTAAVAMGKVPTSLTQPTRTLSYGAYDMAVGDKMAAMAPHNQYGMVMTLVGVVLLLNIVAILLRGRMSRKLRGQ